MVTLFTLGIICLAAVILIPVILFLVGLPFLLLMGLLPWLLRVAGVVLLTNDGAFANALTHPRHAYSKKYRVTIRGKVDDSALLQLREGIDLDGRMTAPCDVTVLTAEENRTVLEFVLHEGRNRQIRRMCEAVELEVIRLKRIAVGSLKLGMLPVGKWRELTDTEVQKLMRSGALQTEDTKK